MFEGVLLHQCLLFGGHGSARQRVCNASRGPTLLPTSPLSEVWVLYSEPVFLHVNLGVHLWHFWISMESLFEIALTWQINLTWQIWEILNSVSYYTISLKSKESLCVDLRHPLGPAFGSDSVSGGGLSRGLLLFCASNTSSLVLSGGLCFLGLYCWQWRKPAIELSRFILYLTTELDIFICSNNQPVDHVDFLSGWSNQLWIMTVSSFPFNPQTYFFLSFFFFFFALSELSRTTKNSVGSRTSLSRSRCWWTCVESVFH